MRPKKSGTPMDQFPLWHRTLADQPDTLNPQREILRQAFLSFRDRTAQLVGEIGGLLPGLTVHDITHIDALWRVAFEIAGPDYPLNPAEAFVLGGAFLLHDAAHVLAAYEDGLIGVKNTIDWKDLIAQRFEDIEPTIGSPQERSALFQVLRHLHAKQARRLAKLSWKVPGTGEQIHLLENFHLREYYGDLIGEIAESHRWPAHRVAETFEHRHVSAPGILVPAAWSVDTLKVAFLLRTADAAHIDGQRAPWFLFALRDPEEISQLHWNFQAKMGQPARTDRNELRLSSGSVFDANDRQSWWLAYDAACMIDREIRDAQILMRDAGRKPFATTSVEHASSPEAFAINVRTAGWEPVNVAPKVGNVPKVIANLGGAKLYGDRPELALRELIQNAADAVRALRMLGGIGEKEGEIEVALVPEGDLIWLHLTDNGIGMSRYVLTEFLLDFGNSLWSSETLRTELPGLASKGFKAVGRFGIGFFSVFMLGRKVAVTTRRFVRASSDYSDQWLLEFGDGLDGRPTLRRPVPTEELRRPGTRVSVALDQETFEKLQGARFDPYFETTGRRYISLFDFDPLSDLGKKPKKVVGEIKPDVFSKVFLSLCPTLDVKVLVRISDSDPMVVVIPDAWKTLEQSHLLSYLTEFAFVNPKSMHKLIDIREATGDLLGRITYHGSSFAYAIVTHGGLRSGIVPKLAGVLLGHNNANLSRNDSSPQASREAWHRWVEAWIDSAADHSVGVLSDLHPLCPERDLAVYLVGSKQLNEAQLSDWLKQQVQVRVVRGQPEQEDYDDVSIDRFNQYFRVNADIVVLPKSDGQLEKSLAFPPINYTKRLQAALTMAWGDFEMFEEDDVCVGEVDGCEIIRWVYCYGRVTTG